MLIQPTAISQRGFSLVELLIAVGIVGILLGLAFPGYQKWIQNTQIRTAAESIQNGLQLARAEAVKRNVNIEFVLTAALPLAANVTTAAANAAGPNWIVRVFPPADPVPALNFIQGRPATEGSSNSVISVAVGASASVVFTSLGRIAAPPVPGIAAAQPDPIRIDVTNSALAVVDRRPLRVLITSAGQIRMCDPSAELNVNDPRRCP